MYLLKPLFTLLSLLLLSAGCAHAAKGAAGKTCAATPSEPSPAERVAKQGTVLDLYFRQDGAWLPGAPIMVNEDFDFMLATTMEDGVGVGLATAKRKQNNEKRAKELAALALSDVAKARIAELRCCSREVYFVLWGPSTLKIVVDHVGEVGRGVIAEERVAGELDVQATTQAAEKLLSGMDCAS